MYRWNISSSRDGYAIHLYDVKPWAAAVEWTYGSLCELTRGWLGGHGLPGVFWRIPVGKPVYDYDPEWADDKGRPMLENSVAWQLNQLEGKMLMLTERFGRELTERSGIPISDELARQISPDFAADIDSIRNDQSP